jgi:hypothetical protein
MDARRLGCVLWTIGLVGCAGAARSASVHPLCEVSPLLRMDCRQDLRDDDGDGWPTGLERALVICLESSWKTSSSVI